MSKAGTGAAVAVIVLVLVGVALGAAGATEISQPTSKMTTTYTSYSASISPVLNVSLRPNQLYSSSNLTDPRAIFPNITSAISFSAFYEFEASHSTPVLGEVATEAIFYSGTTPSWSTVALALTQPIASNASVAGAWLNLPLNLSAILNSSAVIDNELGLSPGAGTLVLNTSLSLAIPGQQAANNSSISLSFDYTTTAGKPIVPTVYAAIEVTGPTPGLISGVVSNADSIPLPSHATLGEEFLLGALAAFVAAALVGWGYLPRRRGSPLERFLEENGENVVRVGADSRPAGKAVAVPDLEELVKIANIAGQPIFLFESPTGRGAFLYVISGDATFGLSLPPEDVD